MTKLQKQVHLALLTALALIIYIVELQIPPLVPMPGIKLGLANMISLTALLVYGPIEAFSILLLRILLGSLLTGNMVSLIFSLMGGIFSIIGMALLYRYFKDSLSLWVISICGGIFHNIGQLFIASVIVENIHIYYYLPILILSGSITGYFIGLGAKFIAKQLNTYHKF